MIPFLEDLVHLILKMFNTKENILQTNTRSFVENFLVIEIIG